MAEQSRAVVPAAQDKYLATDVQEGVAKALTTNAPNMLAMTFEQTDQSGKKVVSPYVRKAGRSILLNEVAKRKGGLALMQAICVRSAQETKDDLIGILAVLSEELKKQFIASRGGDFRFLTFPNGEALYKFVVVFRNGEKWEGEGIANVRNVKNPKLHDRLNEMAETRAFMRCIGRGIADGFISPEQAAGSEHYDDAEAALLAEDEAMEQDYIDVTGAEPGQAESFRPPVNDGVGATSDQPAPTGRPVGGDSAEAAGGEGVGDQPADAGVQGDGGGVRHDRADHSSETTDPKLSQALQDITVEYGRRVGGWAAVAEVLTKKGMPSFVGKSKEQRAKLYFEYLGRLDYTEAVGLLIRLRGLESKGAQTEQTGEGA